ncbi:GNAT family N-acetyltransferase [Salipaludibacillus daqingensis]|uniref:GNAT family N-acetyltransferase n=1 Tax=Salipaludibacillus daqingensis TaxID=3041001 RepID=UPI002476CD1F|nr:GNAT family protein [Salipaludibacillus daqingensis]
MISLETDRLLLRPLHGSDANRIEELASKYDVAKTTLNIPHPYPPGSAKNFIQRVNISQENGELVIFAIIEKSSQHLIGLINIKINATHKRGELGYWIGASYWGQGYCTEAARELLRYCFKELDLNKVLANAFKNNPGSWRVMEKIGLIYEGTLKQHVYRFDQFYDLMMYGLIKDEYE